MSLNVIFGAGKIARGFIGHLLYLNKEDFIFIDKNDELVQLINKNKQYTINILGAPEKNTIIKNVKALSYSNEKEIIETLSTASTIFTAIGGKNLKEIIPFIVKGLSERFTKKINIPINIITCENWKKPADIIKQGIIESLDKRFLDKFNETVGITEAVILRSAIEPSEEMLRKDPLTVNVQDYWELPIDTSRIKGTLPNVKEIKLLESFQGFLERKFYTYNAANATVSYLGYLKGYKKIADAAHDPEILKILMGVYDETSRALSKKHSFPLEEQQAFCKTSLSKLQNYVIEDYIERNARDPIRKLGPEDRLIGAARLVMEYGIEPQNLATAIAAAIYYDNPVDPIAIELKKKRETEGVDKILKDICEIDPKGKLATIIKDKIQELKKLGWIHEKES
jgi:mannitol-1-phosphate 5-dehydrogenase